MVIEKCQGDDEKISGYMSVFNVTAIARASLFDLFDGVVKVFGTTGLAKELFEQAHTDVGDSLGCGNGQGGDLGGLKTMDSE